MKKSSTSNYKYRTTGTKGSFKRTAYKRKNPKISLFQDVKKSMEYKAVDTAQVDATLAASVNTFSAPVALNAMSQGTTSGTRVGRRITMKSFQYRLQFSAATGASANPNPIRVLVVYDKQSNGAAAAATDILTTNTFVSPINLNNSDRFIVISDLIHESGAAGPSTGDCYRKLSLEAIYGGNAGTIADINTGAVLLMVASTGSASVTYNLYPRIRYTDA